MRDYFSKQRILWAVLLLVALSQRVLAQAPPYPVTQAPTAPTSPAGYTPIYPNYAPMTPNQPLGVSSFAPPEGGWPITAKTPTQPASPNPAPASRKQSPLAKLPFFKKSDQKGAPAQPAPTSPPPRLMPVESSPPARVPSARAAQIVPQQNHIVAQPAAVPQASAVPGPNPLPLPVASYGAPPVQYAAAPIAVTPQSMPAQLTAAQAPPGAQAGTVVVYMPAGWQPPGDQLAIGPREVSPEVPDDFWPGRQRNPLGDEAGAGIFRWPKVLRGETADDDEEPVRPRQAKALFAAGRQQAAPAPAPAAQAAEESSSQSWRDVLAGTTSGRPSPSRNKSKALFSIGRKSPTPVAAAQPTPARAVPRQAEAPLAQFTGPRPAEVRATASPAVHSQPATADDTAFLADAPVLEDDTDSNLRWRAKGSPRRAVSEHKPAVSQRSGNQVANHVEPVESMPAAPTITEHEQQPVATPQPQPVYRQVQPQPMSQPTEAQRANAPRSFLNGQPLNPNPELEIAPNVIWTSGPQASSKALLPIVSPRDATRPTPMSAPRSAPMTAPSPTGIASKALLPGMFSKDSPSEIGLMTKPPADRNVPTPVPATPVRVIVVREGSTAEVVDSYYVPASVAAPLASRSLHDEASYEDEPPARAGAYGTITARQQQRYQQDLARMQIRQQEHSQPPDNLPALARPLRAISEMTKLPSFLIGGKDQGPAGGNGNPRPPRFREAYPHYGPREGAESTAPNRPAARHNAAPANPQSDPRGNDDYFEETEPDEMPDVSIDPPTSRRVKQHKAAGDEPAAKPVRGERRQHSALADTDEPQPEGDDLPDVEAPSLATYYEPQDEFELPDEPEASIDDDQPAALDRNRDASSVDDEELQSKFGPISGIERKETSALPPGRTRAVRKRKADGTSVIVYYTGKARPRVAKSTRQSESDEDAAGRANPLRRPDEHAN